MQRPSLTIFANFFIDNDERFKRMKDSFYSFKGSNPDQWVINIRGRLKYQAGQFLKKELGEKISISNLQSKKGWFYDTKVIASHITSDYIFVWIEDHILVDNPTNLNNCIAEMKKFDVDQLWYSFLTKEVKDRFAILPPHKKGEYITVTKIDSNACSKIHNELKNDFYTIAIISIMRKDFFMKVIYTSKPYLKRWPRNLPFDFEKKSNDKVLPIIWHALPNKELFVAIDDDQGMDGYSLISRGIYPNLVSRDSLKKMEFPTSKFATKNFKHIIPKKIRPLLSIIVSFLRRAFYTVNIFYNK